MSLAAALTEEEASLDVRKTCTVCAWYDLLNEADRLAFDQWLDTPGRTRRALWRACGANGLEISESQFERHVKFHHGAR
ncbi:MAG: hypothetical protein CK431_16980 [Mycobacterium sp.]|nr:MAG: hypothetical protein CK431_16980 [Mycobacterium sp.]